MNRVQLILEIDTSYDIPLDVILDELLLQQLCLGSGQHIVTIDLPENPTARVLCIKKHEVPGDRQKVRLEKIQVDGVHLPDWVINKYSTFSFNGEIHQGSDQWFPPGTWTWAFESPIVTWILDQKIAHEANYTQDYRYPWSYQLGPDSVRNIGGKIEQLLDRVNRFL
jgi:hypothetical protein